MYEVLVREAAARFGLGDKALQVLQMLLAYMTARDRGGLAGFLEKFKAAGLGPVIQSWLGGGPTAQPISNSQIETVLGSSGGLLPLITERLDLDRDNVASALGYLLPAIVGRLTPGGSIVNTLPPEVVELAQAGETLLAAPVRPRQATVASGGLMRWLPWVVVALAVVFGLSYLGRDKGGEAPAADTPPAAASDAAAGGALEPPAVEATPQAAPSVETPVEAQPPVEEAPAAAAEPLGAAVQALQVDGQPAVNVYFESGKTEVDAVFDTAAAELVEHLKTHAEARAVISGFNDSTGDAAANAELSKNRALAVQAALVAAGVDEGRTELLKPLDTSTPAVGNGDAAAARRVEVRLAP